MHVRGATNSNSCHKKNNNPCDGNTRTAACPRPLLSPSSPKKLLKKAFNSCLCSKTRIAWLCVCVCVYVCACWLRASAACVSVERRAVTADSAVNVGIATTFCGSVGDLSPRAQHAVRTVGRVSDLRNKNECPSADNSLNFCVFLLCFKIFLAPLNFQIAKKLIIKSNENQKKPQGAKWYILRKYLICITLIYKAYPTYKHN